PGPFVPVIRGLIHPGSAHEISIHLNATFQCKRPDWQNGAEWQRLRAAPTQEPARELGPRARFSGRSISSHSNRGAFRKQTGLQAPAGLAGRAGALAGPEPPQNPAASAFGETSPEFVAWKLGRQ
ncbi:hypothetical protein P7K49_012871, partial [Saguinus oedipus]